MLTSMRRGRRVILCIGSIKNDCNDSPCDLDDDSNLPRKSQNAWFSLLQKREKCSLRKIGLGFHAYP